ncbi:uncharacterized protein LOC111104725 isoform X2 [Crassostrea virginica]
MKALQMFPNINGLVSKSDLNIQEMKYQILQCFFLILYRPNSVTSFNCSRNSKETCLTDCSWSAEENKCKDCPPGFYGIKCLSLCRYPNYGDNCQQDCSNCSEQQCDSVFGCLTGNPLTIRRHNTLQDEMFGSCFAPCFSIHSIKANRSLFSTIQNQQTIMLFHQCCNHRKMVFD